MILGPLKNFFKTAPLKNLFKNTGLLAGGDFVSAVLGILTFSVSARALGTETLGILILIDAYVRIVDKLINFQSWQFMIKFGSDALAEGDAQGFKALVKLGTLVDLCTALLGCAVSMGLAAWVGQWQHWPPEIIRLAVIYSLIVAFDVAGVPTGILRIFDKFKLFSVQKSACAALKFFGALWAWLAGYGLQGFVWVWMATEIFDYLSLTVMGWMEMHRRGYPAFWKAPLRGLAKRYPGLWGFLISTNLTGSVKVGFREFDVLIVGKLLSLTDVSLYKLAKKLCASLDRLTNPLFQSLYPELARLWAQRDFKNFQGMVRHMMYVMGGISLAVWLLFVLFGHEIILLIAGPAFRDSYSVTVWYLLANGIAIATLPLAPMILAMGRAHLNFWIQFIPTLLYFPVLFWMILAWHLNGAGYACLVYHGCRAVLQYFVIRLHLLPLLSGPGSETLIVSEAKKSKETNI